MVPLTEPQRKVVEFIFEHLRETGLPPTLREICQQLGWNAVGSAQDVVAALRKKGVLVQPERGKARQIVLSPWMMESLQKDKGSDPRPTRAHASAPGFLWVPLLGYVQAGSPNEAIETAGERVPFHFPQANRRRDNNFFALVVEGYSMANAGFLPGDQILVERAGEARDGDVVVASTMPGEATVKRYAVRGSELYRRAVEQVRTFRRDFFEMPPAFLFPENPLFEPIPFGNNEHSRILGLVRSLVRTTIH